jgi:3-hydroxybutyryl-CoA dehydrogenase
MIKNIVIVGAGRMGRGIAAICSRSCVVTLYDLEESIVKQAREDIISILGFLFKRKLITESEFQSAPSRIRYTLNLDEAVRNADLINESIPERIELKKELFAQLDRLCREETILASNTSTLSISEIAATTNKPGRVLGIHWVYPPYIMPAVEIIVGKQTSTPVSDSAKNFILSLGKIPIVCKDTPGFVINRLQLSVTNEATRLLEQGVATAEDIDNAARFVMGLRLPFWGPLRIEDMVVSKATQLANYEYLTKEVNEMKYSPPKLLREKVQRGELGAITGKGYYDYTNKVPAALVEEMSEMIIKLLKFLSELRVA